MTLLSSILLKDVCIEWMGESDWRWYTVLNWDDCVNGEIWILLDGRVSPDGTKFNGPPFWSRLSDIRNIMLGDITTYWSGNFKDDDSI
jgi:hypothetical protein